MIDVNTLDPTGYSGTYTYTSGAYSVTGSVTTDADKAIRVLSGDVSKTISSVATKVATFSVYFNATDDTLQDEAMGIMEDVRQAFRDYLDTPEE